MAKLCHMCAALFPCGAIGNRGIDAPLCKAQHLLDISWRVPGDPSIKLLQSAIPGEPAIRFLCSHASCDQLEENDTHSIHFLCWTVAAITERI